MTIARYSFLPWLRRGIANQLQSPATTASRAKLAVTLTVASEVAGATLPPKDVQLIGPGDIIGCSPQPVIRTEPRHWVADFEPNYLAFIEFYDEDLAWRYTPAGPDTAAHRLTPWITLVLLKETEFRRDDRPGQPLSSITLTPAASVPALFAPDNQLWAWAHVHVNENFPAGNTPNLEVLEVTFRRSPDTAYCRLVCPRRLEPNTGYYAFVIPTFEVGRRAGLGEKVPDNVPGLDIAWKTATQFPVYYEWFFRTGAAGDFEELVKALKPRPIPKEVGIRDLDIQRPGFGLPAIVSAPDDVVGLEGALLSPFTVPKPLDPASNFPAEIEKQVNLAADAADTGLVTAGDPLVTAPLYGRWHALVNRISAQPQNRNWVNELNSDPRFRAAAGMGTLVIQKHQEEYMKLAWQQIGEILAANRKVHFVQMAMKANQAAFIRHFAPLAAGQALPVLAPVYRKVMGSPVTVHYLVQESRLTRATLSGPMRKALRPRGPIARRALPEDARASLMAETLGKLNDGTISAAPPRPPATGPTLERTTETVAPPPTAFLRWLLKWAGLIALVVLVLLVALWFAAPGVAMTVLVAVGAVATAFAYGRARRLRRIVEAAEALAPVNLTPEAVAAIPPNASFTLAPAGQNPPTGRSVVGPDSAEARDFRMALTDFHALLSLRVPAPAPRPAIALAAVHTTVMRTVEPSRAFPLRVAPWLRVGDVSLIGYAAGYADAPAGQPVERIVPAKAYPDIKKPMYEPLRDISEELFVPNLRLIPPNTVSLMVQNQPFIESYMVGLNHEFGRELLWREYPTDQRPSTFRQFWDASNYVDREGLAQKALAEKVRDITRIHEWPSTSQLGDHNNRDPLGLMRRNADPDQRALVLVIRGDLLKRYPNTTIYAQRAKWGERPDNQLRLVLWDETGEKSEADPREPNIRFPLYRAKAPPDIHFIGFDLTLGEARGDKTLAETADARARLGPGALGWFFVIKEVAGEPRFGLDEHAGDAPSPRKWDNLTWDHLGADVKVIDVAKPFTSQPPGTDPSGVKWGTNAADMAYILYQKPVLVAIHARDMLVGLT
jgi:hypothetical protein